MDQYWPSLPCMRCLAIAFILCDVLHRVIIFIDQQWVAHCLLWERDVILMIVYTLLARTTFVQLNCYLDDKKLCISKSCVDDGEGTY